MSGATATLAALDSDPASTTAPRIPSEQMAVFVTTIGLSIYVAEEARRRSHPPSGSARYESAPCGGLARESRWRVRAQDGQRVGRDEAPTSVLGLRTTKSEGGRGRPRRTTRRNDWLHAAARAAILWKVELLTSYV